MNNLYFNEESFEIKKVNVKSDEEQSKIISEFEKRYEKKIKNIADKLINENKRILMLSGPSSSGKTTTSYRIADELKKYGKTAITISLDNFYKNKADAALGENGEYDFESVNAIYADLVKEKLAALVYEGKTFLPIFDFKAGVRKDNFAETILPDNGVIIVEGIHALNNVVTAELPKEISVKIYVSVHSNFVLDGQVIISKRNVRLLRRMTRDYTYRGSSPENTMNMWGNVCEGEDKYIRPFAKFADVRIDSAFPYDVGILKNEVKELLSMIKNDSGHYSKAQKLLKGIESFESYNSSLLPPTALLREFIGGSTYKY
jgi:uridine kinase